MNVALIKRSSTLRFDVVACSFMLASRRLTADTPCSRRIADAPSGSGNRQAFNFAGKGQAWTAREQPLRSVACDHLAFAITLAADYVQKRMTRIPASTWAEIRTAYASGIGLREIARNMGIPEGTVLARASRERGHATSRQQRAWRSP